MYKRAVGELETLVRILQCPNQALTCDQEVCEDEEAAAAETDSTVGVGQ